jgi:[ribosomal protein S5]-alanine N-acetyltransferase
MLHIQFGDFPVLTTPRLLLRQLALHDAPALFRLRTDPAIMRYLGRPMMQDISEAAAMILDEQHKFSEHTMVTWAVCLREQPDAMIGKFGFWRLDKPNHRAEVGYLLDTAFWGKGLAAEALEVIIRYAFEVLDFHSIMANTDPDNELSGRLLERTGFVQEAYFREDYYFDGRFLDSRIYSLLNPHRQRRV